MRQKRLRGSSNGKRKIWASGCSTSEHQQFQSLFGFLCIMAICLLSGVLPSCSLSLEDCFFLLRMYHWFHLGQDVDRLFGFILSQFRKSRVSESGRQNIITVFQSLIPNVDFMSFQCQNSLKETALMPLEFIG